MAIAFVDVGTLIQETATNSHVIPLPAGVQDNDFLLALLMLDVAPNAITPPGVFTVTAGDGDISLGGGTGEIAWKIASSEPADYTFTCTSSTASVGAILAYRGVDTAAPFNASTTPQAGGNPTSTFADITTSVNGCAVLQIIGADNPNAGGAGTYSTPAGGYTDRVNIQNVAQRNNIAVFELLQGSAGTETGRQSTYGGLSASPNPLTANKALAPSTGVTPAPSDDPPIGIHGRGAGW